jgi:nitrogen fixation protein NifU and related proteins
MLSSIPWPRSTRYSVDAPMNHDLQSLYRDTILKHSRDPINRKPLPAANATAELKNPLCGDLVSIHLTIENDVVIQAAFEAQCCSICMASASMLTRKIEGLPLAKTHACAGSLVDMIADSEASLSLPDDEDLNALSGVKDFPSRIRCATLPWETLLAALEGRVKNEE